MKLIDYQKAYEQDKNNIELKNKYLKACFQVLKESNGYKNEIKDRAIYEGISTKLILQNTKEYIVKVLGDMTEEEYHETIHFRTMQEYKLPLIRKNPCNELMIKLMGVDDENKIINLIDSSGVDYNYIRVRIPVFVNTYFKNKKYLIEVFRTKLNIYIASKKPSKKEKIKSIPSEKETPKQLEEKRKKYKATKSYITNFINSPILSEEEFCKSNNLSMTTFLEYTDLVKKFNSKLYQKYLDKINKGIISSDTTVVNTIKQMVYFLEHGIKYDNGVTRAFDPIDYYQFVGLNVQDLYWYLDNYNFTAAEIKKIKTLMDRGGILSKINSKEYNETERQLLKNIINENTEYGSKKDKNGLPISGTGRIIDICEKEKIITLLKEINAPLTRKNYTIACRRYINGTLLFNKEETKEFYKKRIKQ